MEEGIPPDDSSKARRGSARRPWVLAAGLLAAVAAAWAAPEPWPPSGGTLRVAVRGEVALEASLAPPVTEGAVFEGVHPRGPVRAAVPEWRGPSRPLRVEVGAPAGTVAGDLRVSLLLADGRDELVPVTGRGRDPGSFLAERRPPVRAAPVAGLLALVVVLWVTEAVPLFVASLLVPVVLVVAGVAGPREALAPFFDPIIALFFGGFLMAEAMKRAGLDRRTALHLVALGGRSPALLFATLMAVSAFLSMWMSNTASTALLVPIAMAVAAPLGRGYLRAAVLGISYAGTTGGMGSLTGTPANLLATRFVAEFTGRTIPFPEWFAFGLPMVVLLLPVAGAWLWFRSGVRVDPEAFAAARRNAREELARAGRPDRAQGTVLAVFAAVVAAWLAQGWLHEIHPGVVALAGAVALALLGKVLPVDLGRISWDALLTFGGGIAMGLFVVQSGLGDALATRLEVLSGTGPLVGTAAVAGLTLVVTAFASNTASAAMMIPLAIPLAPILGVDPALLAITAALASSVDFALVIGTPPTMIAYSTGLYSTGEIFRTGVLLDLAGIALLVTAVAGTWRLLGVV